LKAAGFHLFTLTDNIAVLSLWPAWLSYAVSYLFIAIVYLKLEAPGAEK
jgi:hypothetical protein